MKKNVLVFVHGMTTDVAPSNPTQPGRIAYDQFWTALQARKPELKDLFPNGPIKVKWGHQLSPNENPVRDDHKLTEVERFVNDQVSYRNLEHHSDRIIPSSLIGAFRYSTGSQNVRRSVVSFGLTTSVYYGSDDVKRVCEHRFIVRLCLRCNSTWLSQMSKSTFSATVWVSQLFTISFLAYSKKDHEPDFVKHNQGGPDKA